MGALRAAELEKDGMIGIGKIFQAYKSGNVDSDAEVAMIFSAKDYMPLSEPLIHIRFFVQDMIQKQVLSNGEGSTILEVSKNIYFPSLSFSKVFDKIQCCINNEKIEYMKNYYNSHKEEYNIKKKDAKELLNYIAKNKNIIIENGGIKMG